LASTGTGDVTVTVTAHADNTKTGTFTVHVGNWALLVNGSYAMQVVNIGNGSPTTIMANSNACTQSAMSYDAQKIVCTDLISSIPVVKIYATDGTSAGTILSKTIDLSSLGPLNHVTVSYPRFSQDGAKIVFTGVVSGVQGVYTMNADGTSPTRLFQEPASGIAVERARFTPDGRQILFENLLDQTVWAMNADGTSPAQLVNAPSVWAMYSPDMRTLYYASAVGVTPSAYVKDVATGNVRTLSGYDILDVAPNGSGILLTDVTSIYRADALGVNISPTPVATGSWGSW